MVQQTELTQTYTGEQTDWPWHRAEWTTVPLRLLAVGDRRLEAETYLSTGFGVRAAIEARVAGWSPLSTFASVTQPPRTKATLVGPQDGVPFLAATQVFETRPHPRKWLATGRIGHATSLYVRHGQILVTRSGQVGRATLAYTPHLNALLSDDLLRVNPVDKQAAGWLYAYLRAPRVRAMMTGARYGHIIKHLEVGHLEALPVPRVTERWLTHFGKAVTDILNLRDRAYAATLEAEARFEQALGPFTPSDSGEDGFVVQASETVFRPRRRLDAAAHSPRASAILRHIAALGIRTEALSEVTDAVWWLNRFSRVYANEGVPYMSAEELFDLNPEPTKRILTEQARHADSYFPKAGWLAMACSGQTYGLLGSVLLITRHQEGVFLSHDLLRIAPRSDRVRSGYLLTALGHPDLGRPLVLRLAYGTSIPHLDPGDVANLPVVRLAPAVEDAIADLAEQSAELRARADQTENRIATEADELLGRFIAGEGDATDFGLS
jgi:hypothetical protein